MRTKYRLGIDAGGTFTDLVLADRSGDVRLYKALSTPADPTSAIEEGMALIAEDLGESPAEIVSNSDLCINGTTVGLNALIQHKGGGSKLGAGATIKGPAIIEEVTTTIVIEPKWTARLDVSSSYILTRR